MAEFPLGHPQPRAARRTGMATAALVLGIISIPATFVCVGPVLGITAIVLGAVGLSQARRQPERYDGGGRAVGGIVTGSVALVLTLLLVVLGAVLFSSLGQIVPAAMDMQQLSEALKAYEGTHHDYPPDLATLAAEGLVRPNPLRTSAPSAEPFGGFTYVQGVHPSDPPKWILAYKWTTLGPISMVLVLYADGSNDTLDGGAFAAALAKFNKEYEAARGSPPETLPAKEPP